MFDPQKELLLLVVQSSVAALRASSDEPGDPGQAGAWSRIREAMDAIDGDPIGGDPDEDLALAVELEDAAALDELLESWTSGARHLPEHDRTILKRAMKSFRKRLKLTLLDAESSLGGGPMSGGRASDIVGITPPAHYGREVWDELVRQGRLVADRHGTYELPPE